MYLFLIPNNCILQVCCGILWTLELMK